MLGEVVRASSPFIFQEVYIMIELTNTVAQTIAPGAAVTFNRVVLHSGCGECYNSMVHNSVKLRSQGIYEVHFAGNISGTTAGVPVQLAIAIGSSALPETVMVSTPSVANAFNNVSTATLIKNCCCDLDRVTVVNTGTVPVLLSANMNLFIKRLS